MAIVKKPVFLSKNYLSIRSDFTFTLYFNASDGSFSDKITLPAGFQELPLKQLLGDDFRPNMYNCIVEYDNEKPANGSITIENHYLNFSCIQSVYGSSVQIMIPSSDGSGVPQLVGSEPLPVKVLSSSIGGLIITDVNKIVEGHIYKVAQAPSTSVGDGAQLVPIGICFLKGKFLRIPAWGIYNNHSVMRFIEKSIENGIPSDVIIYE